MEKSVIIEVMMFISSCFPEWLPSLPAEAIMTKAIRIKTKPETRFGIVISKVIIARIIKKPKFFSNF